MHPSQADGGVADEQVKDGILVTTSLSRKKMTNSPFIVKLRPSAQPRHVSHFCISLASKWQQAVCSLTYSLDGQSVTRTVWEVLFTFGVWCSLMSMPRVVGSYTLQHITAQCD